ncbi:RNA polymerase sigma factor [Ferrimonas lipolytica]|uniref:RNA polymerase sigma factor n=1 Tax=Ferrimonas lipolytica TaxID=2724191 RepID=A0A6H1UFZ2_9GAMM|nr:RNA polymerase sigma factor [Ferrimonas lipolytica]QIZ77520.1 RNA polymerase sigma factor [Ferrimonas lipolytica]
MTQPPEDHTEHIEQQWIALAQAGDQAAFSLLFEHHHRRVYALCLRLCHNPRCAEDATQEVFLRLWQKLDQYRGGAKFSTWLHRLCINHAINYQRQGQWWRQFITNDEQAEIEITENHSDGIDRLLPKLPVRRRQVFVLHAIEGYQHNEIGTLLGISSGASKAHYHHARQQLQEWLQ